MSRDATRAWVTGAAGLIGHDLVQTAPAFAPGSTVRGLTRADLELTDYAAVRRAFREERPDVVLHCAAASRTPFCTAHPQIARRNNVEVTATLAELAADIPFFFFSTDLVFDGQKGLYVETDPVNPIGVYAETKAEAERIVQANPRHTIIRAGLNAGISLTGDRAFNEQMRLTWEAGKGVDLFTDEFRCPIAAVVTARAVWELVNRRATGLFHLAGAARLSRHEIGTLLAARWPQLNPRITASSLKTYRGAPRCPDVSMNCGKVQQLLSFPLPRFDDWLAEHPGLGI
jgi:dTDP-4-dehydrorhamnose reductase